MDMEGGSERRMHSCRIIPERGSWIELNVTRKESLAVRIDQSGKFSVMTLLRAMDPKYGENSSLLRLFYATHVEATSMAEARSRLRADAQWPRRRASSSTLAYRFSAISA
jgi:DNA-directed RNA polymerase subunit beta